MVIKCEHAFKEKFEMDGRLIEQCEQCGKELMNIDSKSGNSDEVTERLSQPENPDIMHFCHPAGISCNGCLKACEEGYHQIRKQIAEEIFKELDAYFNGDNWNMGVTYQKIKKKYLGGKA